MRITELSTPSVAEIHSGTAGVTDRLMEISDLVALLEADERGLDSFGANETRRR